MRKCTYYSLFCTEKRFNNYFDDKSPVRIPYKVVANLSKLRPPSTLMIRRLLLIKIVANMNKGSFEKIKPFSFVPTHFGEMSGND